MNKKIKIGSIIASIIILLVLLDGIRTHAIDAQLNFYITGVVNTQCTYGTSWDMWQYTWSLTAFTASWNVTDFSCTDMQWLSSWSMTLQATTPVSNWRTSIPATGVSMLASTNYVSAGNCTAGNNTTSITIIGDSPWTILTKWSDIYQICTVTTTWVVLNIAVPNYASIGIYTGTLSLVLPW